MYKTLESMRQSLDKFEDVDAEKINIDAGSSSRWGFSTKTQRYITLGFVANTNLPLF